jgi:cytochrome b
MSSASSISHHAAPRATLPGRRLVDLPTRMFHWLAALCFFGAWLTGESEAFRALHIMLGYSLAGLLGFRLLYGLIGPQQTRLALMWRRFTGCLDGLSNPGGVARALQNLALSASAMLLLLLIVPLTLTGYGANNDWPEWVAALHGVAGDVMFDVVLAHTALVVGLSFVRRKNLAGPMLSGRAPGPGPDLVRHNRGWLAALMLACVLGYGAWAWHQAPNGLIDLSNLSSQSSDHIEGASDD